jgi:hypothetical protein
MPLLLSAKTLGQKGKEELQAIAVAMELDDTGIKGVLLARIKANMKAKPTLAEDPQFLPLFTYKKCLRLKFQSSKYPHPRVLRGGMFAWL